MILNTFVKKDVLEVFDHLMKTVPHIMFSDNFSDYTRETAEHADYLVLHYEALFNRLTLYRLDLDKPLFENPSTACDLAAKDTFIYLAKPSEEHMEMMKDYYEYIEK